MSPTTVHDPREGVTPDGTIRTGASRHAIVRAYDPVLGAAVEAVTGRGALYVYGSVATGTAAVPTSDVDLLSVGLPTEEAARISAELSATFQDLCREVSIAPATWQDLESDGDDGYGLRVFLRHYCVHLHGPDPAEVLPDHPADARAARGFNGDIDQHATRWRTALEEGADVTRLGTRVARKTLLAVAGLVSVRDGTWSTDRRGSAARWDEMEPDHPVGELVSWLDTPPDDRPAVQRALDGPVDAVVRAFRSEIGLWNDH
jgi:uncharacterized protein